MTQPANDFGPYTLNAEIGRGAMGVVHSATQKTLNRQVALKVLRPEYLLDDEYRERFGREAASLAQLSSPHVPHVYEFGEHDSQLFIASQLIPGGNLDDYIAQRGHLPIDDSLDLAFQICSALRDAHSVRVVHRDVKPSNVLLKGGPQLYAYLCDFGIARSLDSERSATQALIGTVSYMAPERFDGEPASPASDLYSLGCLLWAMLSGSAPYLGTVTHVMMQHIREPIPTFQGGSSEFGAVNHVLQRAMAKAPADRYASADEMMADLVDAQRDGRQPGAGHTVVLAKNHQLIPPPGDVAPTIEDTVYKPAVAASWDVPPSPPPHAPAFGPATGNRRRLSPAAIVGLALVACLAIFGVGWGSVALLGDDSDPTTASTAKDPQDSEEASEPGVAEPTDEAAEQPATADEFCAADFYCLPDAGLRDPLAGDFDGDEDPDFAVVARDSAGNWGVSVAHSQGLGFEADSTWTDLKEWSDGSDTAVAADFTGDKLTDVMVVRGVGSGAEASLLKGTTQGLSAPKLWASLPTVTDLVSAAAGRFDGDSRADLAVLTGSEIQVARSQGSSGSSGVLWSRLTGLDLENAQLLGRNFDADDVADLVLARRAGGGKWAFDVLVSTKSQFRGPVLWGSVSGEPHSFVARDMDRNQFTDIAVLKATGTSTAEINVLLNNGNRFSRAAGFDASVSTPQPGSAMLFGGDFNNDLNADVSVVYDRSDGLAKADVWLSKATFLLAPKPLGAVDSWRWR